MDTWEGQADHVSSAVHRHLRARSPRRLPIRQVGASLADTSMLRTAASAVARRRHPCRAGGQMRWLQATAQSGRDHPGSWPGDRGRANRSVDPAGTRRGVHLRGQPSLGSRRGQRLRPAPVGSLARGRQRVLSEGRILDLSTSPSWSSKRGSAGAIEAARHSAQNSAHPRVGRQGDGLSAPPVPPGRTSQVFLRRRARGRSRRTARQQFIRCSRR